MYKSSGKKYKGSREASSISHGKYGTSDYTSDAYLRSDEDDDESLYDGLNSPDYYTGSGKNNFYTHQSTGVGKSNSYYGSAKAPGNERFYSTQNYGGSNYLPSHHHGKHKGKEASYKLNKYQTILLKVQIHCDACIKKVKKAIADIDGVESISVDQKLKRVSVTGYIDPKKVLKKIAKTGKTVELIGGSSSKDSMLPHHMLTNKAAALNALMNSSDNIHLNPAGHHGNNMINTSNMIKPYTVQVEKTSRSNVHNPMHIPQYVHGTGMAHHPQVRSDVDYMFSDDNAHSCSIM